MGLPKVEQLPVAFQNDAVSDSLALLQKRRLPLLFKRIQDVVCSFLLLLLLSPVILVLMVLIKCDSKGPVFFLQERVGKYGKTFRIFKFRTMVTDAEKLGALVTGGNDPRITRMGARLRTLRLDEIPQLINIFLGQMSFVGTRPEVPKYVAHYTDEMMTTLLLPPGLTSLTSIRFRNEAELLEGAEDPNRVYLEQVLPEKMIHNVKYLEKAGPFYDIGVLWKTLTHVFFGKTDED